MELKLKEKIFDIEIYRQEGYYTADIDGKHFAAKFLKINDNTLMVSESGRTYPAYTAEDDKYIYVAIDGRSYRLLKTQDDEGSFDPAGEALSDREVILPPMPGSVVKVLCEKGKKVKSGEPLIIVEAMKMETTLYCSIDGIIESIAVNAGEQVNDDTEMIIVVKETE
ncbi:MAG: biotin/lipoyl-containing protein [Candidatus Kapaibacterium sp.]